MARVRSVDFLPEIFQTPANKKFLNSTLDQLIQEPKLKQTQGYVGRKTAPGQQANDGYVLEPNDRRTNYQLEPGIVFKDDNGDTVDALSYMGLLDGLATNGANTDNHDRLFTSETYSWSPFINFDKFVNYSQYFWLPKGPASANVWPASADLEIDFDITAEPTSFSFDGVDGPNPTISLARTGSYTFNIENDGNPFYIQSAPGIEGTLPWATNISSRDVIGVTNNGEDNGTITFNVPKADKQAFYHNLTDIGTVDLATTVRMDSIADQLHVDVPSIAGIQDIENRTVVFLDDTPGDATTLGWVNAGSPLTNQADRYQIFRIQLEAVGPDTYVRLVPIQQIAAFERFSILFGEAHSNISFFKDSGGYLAQVPYDTAALDTLYYQDATNPDLYGVITLVDANSTAILDTADIIGQPNYTSSNGVVFTNGLKVQFRGTVIPAEYVDAEYYVEGVGDAIQLIPVGELEVPEEFAYDVAAPWDISEFDTEAIYSTESVVLDLDYITINRSSIDRNAWSRSNRWFHIDVIKASAKYNNTEETFDNSNRAVRPIIEFDANLRLLNYGTAAKSTIQIIDLVETDAMSNVNGSGAYNVDGYELIAGSRVIFANDADATVRDKIYTVELIDAEDDDVWTINLVLEDNADSEINDIVVVTAGLTQKGKVYAFDGIDWIESQAKVAVNQAPLFDIVDQTGYSFNDPTVYPSTTFNGTKIFSYAEGTGAYDPVLGIKLKYLNIDNLGDILFDNNLYADTFLYVKDSVSYDDTPVSDGFLRKYYTRDDYTNELGWTKAIEDSRQAQIFEVTYSGNPIEIDIAPATDLLIPAVRITADGTFINSTAYTVLNKIITFDAGIVADGATLEIKVISDDISETGYYAVPANLASNMFNENTSALTLGTIRNHYNALAQNITGVEGDLNGANNLRDFGDITAYGDLIVQQSSPIALAAMFMRFKEYNFFSALTFASRQYEKYKNRLINWVETHDISDMTVPVMLDAAIKEVNAGKTTASPFYWSDMIPSGEDYDTTVYVVTAISSPTFTTLRSYDFFNANTQAMLIYHDDVLLVKDTDYTVATDGPRITLLNTLEVGDVIRIDEYETTVGSTLPSTPTKLGLFPKFKPSIFNDATYVTSTKVIQGHDGSITPAFDDVRDDLILEFETRVYNNIKVTIDIPLDITDVVPGVFRDTGYTDEEITDILAPSLLSWLGWNKIDYKKQEFSKVEDKTWNYSSTSYKVADTASKKGHWRGVYTAFYDTTSPHERPWEMVGLTERPSWWETRYGPAPYTSGNFVLWDDMEAGLVADPDNEHVLDKYKRPGLTQILPVDSEGNLLSPLESVIAAYTQHDFKKSWAVGDGAPAEAAWRKSSAYPFAVQRLFALTKPAQYFALMADRDRYAYNTEFKQYLYDGRHRLDTRELDIFDDSNVKHSYINWIVDYNRHFGYESLEKLKTDVANIDVNLCYHMASFTDKNNLKIFTDKSSPDTTNSSLMFPDESYKLIMYKNQPLDEVIYSSVIVQKTDDGYSVIGNSFTNPYFRVQVPVDTGKFATLSVGRTEKTSTSVKIPETFSDTEEYVPYGHTFTSKQAVAEFLISYGEHLTRQGLQFVVSEESAEVNWPQMVQEFVYWADQGWAVGSIINLNPAATALEFERELHIVDDLNNLELTEQPLNQNREPLESSGYVVDRLDNNFKIRMLNNNIISYLKFNLTNFEHLLVLDNTSIFNDIMYDPLTGVRQHRIKIHGFTTDEWNGQLDAQGFMYNEDNVKSWSPSGSYNTGDITKFKDTYWSAIAKVQPSATFDFSEWIKTDYNKISKGLLPNLATKADQQLHFYNNKTANLESDVDLLAFGATGYRTRDYLQSLDLDDISQVNIYSDMIENKGTSNSLNLFKGVELHSGTTDYDIFENWAIKRAQYGATSSRSYVEFDLPQDKLTANPGLIDIVDSTSDASVSDLLIPVSAIPTQSEKHTDKNIFPVLAAQNLDTALPSAGPVDINDVDISVYDINDIAVDAEIVDGTLIWVAKDFAATWNVYRAYAIVPVVIGVIDNLDGTLTIETDVAHDLLANTLLVTNDVDKLVDGTHNIISVPSTTLLVIEGELAKNQNVITDIEGTLLTLVSARVAVPSDILGTIFDDTLNTTQKVWVANDNNRSATYEKEQPFSLTREQANIAETPVNTDEFGYSISQGHSSTGLLVGSPGFSTNGAAHIFNIKGATDYYDYSTELTLGGSTSVQRYGHAVTLIQYSGAVSAPGDGSTPGVVAVLARNKLLNTIDEIQLLVNPAAVAGAGDSFGSSIAMSQDENWLYVGEPDNNRVHAFQKIEFEKQTVTMVTDGITSIYDISSDIAVSVGNGVNEIRVTLNGTTLTPTTDYTYDGTNVTLVALSPDGDTLIISRRNGEAFNGTGAQTSFAIPNLYALDGLESIVVSIKGVMQVPIIDYSLTGTDVIFVVAPPVGVNNVVINQSDSFRLVDTIDDSITGITLGGSDRFGETIDVTTDSSHIVISAPAADTNTGKAFIINRVTDRFVVTDAAQLSYPTLRPPLGSVVNNGSKLTPDNFNLTPDFTVVGNSILLDRTGITKVGDFLDVDTSEFKLIQEITAAVPAQQALFGNAVTICKSKCSIYLGAEGDLNGAGSVTRYVNGTRLFGSLTSSVQNPVIGGGTTIRINNIEIPIPATTIINVSALTKGETYTIASIGDTDFLKIGAPSGYIVGTTFTATYLGEGTGTITNSATQIATAINAVLTPNVNASATNGYLTIELVNKTINSIANRLDVLTGDGTPLSDMGLESYYIGQTITSPIDAAQPQNFGSSVHIDSNLNQLAVGARGGDTIRPNTATSDSDNITADASTSVDTAKIVAGGGAVYAYDLLSDGADFTAGKIVLGQQMIVGGIADNDNFGNAVSLVEGILVASSVDYTGGGRVVIFGNPDDALCWNATHVQKDAVDVRLINSMYIYDSDTFNVSRYLDYIDPLNGKILGAAQQNIDLITVYDPSIYNDTNTGLLWGSEKVGTIWWDVSTVRFIDYNAGDARQSSQSWGKVFAGSSVDIHTWVESDVPPSEYAGTGTVFDVTKFVALPAQDRAGIVRNTYFYWVNKVESIGVNSEKTLSASSIASYIEAPASSGISFAALIAQNQIGLYNCKDIIQESNSVLHVEYDKIHNDNNVFVEVDLFRENYATDFLTDSLYKKLQDSLCGVDPLGSLVPDPALSPIDKLGIEFRPRKSMFIDRYAALSSYMNKVNGILQKNNVAESRSYSLLESQEPSPTAASGEWDLTVFNREELAFQDLTLVATGYSYLIETDEDADGLWTIYEVTAADTLQVKRIQSFDTTRFWNLEHWYAEGYSPFTKIAYVVATVSALDTLGTVEDNAVAKVSANSTGNWEVHKFINGVWIRVALENGTIKFDERLWNYILGRYGWSTEVFDAQNLDEEPVKELRQIIKSINEEILIGDLAGERNATIMSVFNYILAEQPFVDWLTKTSLIDVTQRVRSLNQYPVYQKDNHDYLLSYIKEVKPYHTKVKDFLLSYDGLDEITGQVTDFDCPTYYSEEYGRYINPILDDGATLVTDQSNTLPTDEIWQTVPWKQWFDNVKLAVSSVIITSPGTGYSTVPDVVVTGDSTTPAVLTAVIGADGTIGSITIDEVGSGYLTTPVITFIGGNGNGAVASAQMSNSKVRSFNTKLKYDRYEYETNVMNWEPATVYELDQLVRVNNDVYKLINADGMAASPSIFDPLDAYLVPIDELSGVDRTFGHYVSDVNNPGLDLSLLIKGIAYPGVEVDGDATDAEIDAIYESSYLDTYLGTRATDINVDGGAFIDTYHSHAPEELVPSAIFDTLDMKVISRPGSDYVKDGHAFDIKSELILINGATQTVSFSGISPHPIKVLVTNITTGVTLHEGIDYTVGWTDQTVAITAGIAATDTVKISVYEIGGGNQLHRSVVRGTEVTADTFNIPVRANEIYNALIFVNGVDTTVTIAHVNNQTSALTLPSAPADNAFITATIFGTSAPVQYEESYPVTQTYVYGTDVTDAGAELSGKNKQNAIVEINGLRSRPPEVNRSISDGGGVYPFPIPAGYLYDHVADNEVEVYVDDVLLTFGEYTLSEKTTVASAFGTAEFGIANFDDGTANVPRDVLLTTPATIGARIDVYVTHSADYKWNDTILVFNTPPTNGDLISITTFKDVRELDIYTQVFQGPREVDSVEIELFGDVDFDSAPMDFLEGVVSTANLFVLDQATVENTNRLWVTHNGKRLAAGSGYIIEDNNILSLLQPVITSDDVVAVTVFSDNIIKPGAIFRLFDDMRGNVGMYKLTLSLYLTQALNVADDIIYVTDASVLGQPNLAIAKFGILTINGEVITYRERDLVANTVSGLRRGTAGSRILPVHPVNSNVYDTSEKSFVPQAIPPEDLGLWDVTTTYNIGEIVKHNGIYWHAYATPTVGEFNLTQWSRYDKIWYAPGTGTASDGRPLQDQTTSPALFIKN